MGKEVQGASQVQEAFQVQEASHGDELQLFTEKLILEKLISKYERSQAYKSRESQTRRIMVKPTEFKKIDFEAYEQKEAFINASWSASKPNISIAPSDQPQVSKNSRVEYWS